MKKIRVTVDLYQKDYDKLCALADKAHEPKATIMRNLIRLGFQLYKYYETGASFYAKTTTKIIELPIFELLF